MDCIGKIPAPPNYPLRYPKIQSNTDHEALNRGTLGGEGIGVPSKIIVYLLQDGYIRMHSKAQPAAPLLTSYGRCYSSLYLKQPGPILCRLLI